MKTSHADCQQGGNHYGALEIDPITYSERNGLTPMEFSVVKYTTRHRDKGGLEDLRKAAHYLRMLMFEEYGAELTFTVKEAEAK